MVGHDKTGVDKREKLLSLTDKGQRLFETINKRSLSFNKIL